MIWEMSLICSIAGLAVGLALLAWSADLFVENAASLARRCGLSTFVVGMFIIGFGTSMPELMVSLFSSLENDPGIALGNAYGSNIANILLILGVSACMRPLSVAASARRLEMPILLAVTVLSYLLLMDGRLVRAESLVLLAIFALWCASSGIGHAGSSDAADSAQAPSREPAGGRWRMVALILVGLVALVGSSRLLVVSAVSLAIAAGVPELVVGLSVVAVGTSLPELASSIAAMAKGEDDMAVGNVIGSNIFNALIVVGVAGVVRPLAGGAATDTIAEVLARDFPAMAASIVLLMVFSMRRGSKGESSLGRAHGVAFLICYAAYMALLARKALAC